MPNARQLLVDKVLDQICKDVDDGDLSMIEELIKAIPEDKLQAFLSEEN